MKFGLRSIVVIAACLLGSAAPMHSQQEGPKDNLGTWLIYFDFLRLSEKSSLHTEAQLRLWEPVSNVNGGLVRLGYNYHVDDNNFLSAGYTFGYFETFRHQSAVRAHDLWQQFMQRFNAGRFGFEHRLRVEEQWLQTDQLDWDYRTRFRYRFLVSYHLGGSGDTDWTINLFNELFLVAEQHSFAENRLVPTIGYRMGKHAHLQLGYMMQTFPDLTLHRLVAIWSMHPDLR